jgi:hypothetical protein
MGTTSGMSYYININGNKWLFKVLSIDLSKDFLSFYFVWSCIWFIIFI